MNSNNILGQGPNLGGNEGGAGTVRQAYPRREL